MSNNNDDAINHFLVDTGYFKNRYMRWMENNPHKSLIYIFTFAGFIFRLLEIYFYQGLMHADEIYQSLEMAHILVYDSGRVPAEFELDNPNDPFYASSRSITFPIIFAIIMYIGKFLNMDYHTGILPMIRILLVINSTILILVVAKLTEYYSGSKNASVIVAAFMAFWFRIPEFTVRSFNNTVLLPLLFYTIYRVLKSIDEGKITRRTNILVIFGFGLTTYNRLDLILIILLFFVFTYDNKKQYYYKEFTIDAATGWGIGMIADYFYYGKIGPPPINWFMFNIVRGESDRFGTVSASFYFREYFIDDKLLVFGLLTIIIAIITILHYKYNTNVELSVSDSRLGRAFLSLFTMNMIVWIVYSNFWRGASFNSIFDFLTFQDSWVSESHKEARFIIPGLILFVMMFGISIDFGLNLLFAYLEKSTRVRKKITIDPLDLQEIRYWSKSIVVFLIIFSMIVLSINVGASRHHKETFDDLNKAFIYVGQQDDLTGLIVTSNWFETGGYTLLHASKDVEIRYFDFTLEIIHEKMITEFRDNVTNWMVGNYLIVSGLQRLSYPQAVNVLIDNGWYIEKVIDGKSEIWQRI